MKTNWAILGPGTVANAFAKGLNIVPDAQLLAVGELPQFHERAVEFAAQYDIPRIYKGIDELCDDNEIDIVYISMITMMHKQAVLTCLKAKKHVLCEKPITINQKDYQEMIECAKENDVFLMEALWTNFLPAVIKAKEWIESGIIGEIKFISADFGFRVVDRNGRLFNKSLGGGALIDMGSYTIGLPMILLDKKPLSVQSSLVRGEEGIDEIDTITMTFEEDVIVRAHNTYSCTIRQDLIIYGTEGYICLPNFWRAETAELYMNRVLKETFSEPFETTGYNFEAQEVIDCIAAGRKESDIMPHAVTLSRLEVIDQIRRDNDFLYDNE